MKYVVPPDLQFLNPTTPNEFRDPSSVAAFPAVNPDIMKV